MTRIYQTKGQTALFPRAKPPRESQANRGMEFEAELNAMHRLYRRLKKAVVEKTYCKSIPINGNREAKIIGKAIVDYVGTLEGGRSVAFDAKDCVERRITLDRLADHQIAYLGDVYALGGMAFILVRFERKRCYKIPVDAWASAVMYHTYGKWQDRVDGWKPKNAASLCEDDMKDEWAVNGVDWLGGIEK